MFGCVFGTANVMISCYLLNKLSKILNHNLSIVARLNRLKAFKPKLGSITVFSNDAFSSV